MIVDLSRVSGKVHAMANGLVGSIPNLILAIVILGLFVGAARLARNFSVRTGKRYRHSHNLGLVIGRLIEWAIGLAGALVAISVVAPSFQAKDLINMLGISGLAIGFAFKDIFQNFLAGIILLVTRPFELGDQIAAGGFEGTVEAIETRATTIRTYDGRRVVIPNSTLFTEPLSVNTAFGQLESEYEVHVKAGQDVDQARNRLREAISSVSEVLREPAPEVLMTGFGDDNITLLARWWTAPRHTESLHVRHQVLSAIHEALGALAPGPAMAGR